MYIKTVKICLRTERKHELGEKKSENYKKVKIIDKKVNYKKRNSRNSKGKNIISGLYWLTDRLNTTREKVFELEYTGIETTLKKGLKDGGGGMNRNSVNRWDSNKG